MRDRQKKNKEMCGHIPFTLVDLKRVSVDVYWLVGVIILGFLSFEYDGHIYIFMYKYILQTSHGDKPNIFGFVFIRPSYLNSFL